MNGHDSTFIFLLMEHFMSGDTDLCTIQLTGKKINGHYTLANLHIDYFVEKVALELQVGSTFKGQRQTISDAE